MKLHRLAIAFGILLLLGAAIWYSQKHPPQPESSAPDTPAIKLISVKEDQIQRIRITHPAGETISLQKGPDGKWRITEPKDYLVDEPTVNGLLYTLSSLNADQVVAEKNTDWKTYGLDPGKAGIEVSLVEGGGKDIKLTLGDEAPTSNVLYARLEGDSRLLALAGYLKASLDKSVSDLRDKRLLPLDSEKLSRVTLRNQALKNQAVEFARSGTAWQIVKPRVMRADNYAVDDLVRAVREANSQSEEKEKPASSSPFAAFEAVDPSGNHKLTITKDKNNNYYAESTAVPGLFKVTSGLGESLNKNLDSLRNKKIFDFGGSDPQKLELCDGDLCLNLEKKSDKGGDKWLLQPEPARGAGRSPASAASAGLAKPLPLDKVQVVLDKLRGLEAKSFPSDQAADQRKYGLDKPVVKITSDDGKRTEKVVLAASRDGKWYAAREKEPATYEIEKTGVEDLRKSIAALK